MNPYIYAPPPPPPPAAQAPPPPPTQGHGGFGSNTNNPRGGGHSRGRGGGFRGGNRGTYHGHSNAPLNPHSSANATPIGRPQAQSYSQGLPNYPQWQQPAAPQLQTYGQAQAGAMSYSPSYRSQTTAQNTYPPPAQQPNLNPYYGYGAPQHPTQYSLPQVQPSPMVPQVQVGFNQASYKNNGINTLHGPIAPRNDFNKRKRSLGAHNSNHAAETKPEKKPRVSTAPPVPAFGGNLPAANLALPARPDWLSTRGKSKTKHKNRKNNALGLTPSSDVHEEAEEVDEEAAFAQRVGSLEVLEFEHKGRKISLVDEEARNAYLADRRANYPTQARIAEKQAKIKAEREARREKNKRIKLEANAKKLLDKMDDEGKVTFEIFTEDPRVKKPVKQKKRSKMTKVEVEDKDPHTASNSKDPKVLVAYLEEQLKSAPDTLVGYLKEQLQSAKDAVAAAADESVFVKNEGDALNVSVKKEENASTGSVKKEEDASSSDASSSMSESDSDSDAPPEETSTKPQAPISIPPPRREVLAATSRPKSICQNFKRTGHCKFGRKCRFSHDGNAQNQSHNSKNAAKAASKPARKSLHEVMVEKEQKQDAVLAVSVIRHLGSMGFFM